MAAATKSNGGGSSATMTNPASLIEQGQLRFLITDAPRDANLQAYIREYKKHGVTDVVRTCEVTYARTNVEKAGIRFHEMECTDGAPPTDEVVTKWLEVCTERFGDLEAAATADAAKGKKAGPCISVHCIAGLGRAPILVCVALIEAGISGAAAIDMVRKRRSRALNRAQIKWLTHTYKRRATDGGCCIVS